MGLLHAFGVKTRVQGQNVLVAWHNDLDDGGAVEADKIKVALKPSGKRLSHGMGYNDPDCGASHALAPSALGASSDTEISVGISGCFSNASVHWQTAARFVLLSG
jgi:hypothetical protein